jgi:hypothetical protein
MDREKRRTYSAISVPSYSPELNPDEILNQDFKSNTVGRNRAHSQNELIVSVRSFLPSRQRRLHIVKRYFLEKRVNLNLSEKLPSKMIRFFG